jgi:hypothetical protein
MFRSFPVRQTSVFQRNWSTLECESASRFCPFTRRKADPHTLFETSVSRRFAAWGCLEATSFTFEAIWSQILPCLACPAGKHTLHLVETYETAFTLFVSVSYRGLAGLGSVYFDFIWVLPMLIWVSFQLTLDHFSTFKSPIEDQTRSRIFVCLHRQLRVSIACYHFYLEALFTCPLRAFCEEYFPIPSLFASSLLLTEWPND